MHGIRGSTPIEDEDENEGRGRNPKPLLWKSLERHGWYAKCGFCAPSNHMSTEQKIENAPAKPVFSPLAAISGVIILLGGAWTMGFVFKSSQPLDVWRYIVESGLFLFTGATWVYAAFTGRWGFRK
jgi:hypothetical protein